MYVHRPTHLKAISCSQRANQTGASLLEVLIAILIMSFGITGIALLMSTTIQYNKTSQYQMVAWHIATQLAESMRANTDGFWANAYLKTDSYSASRQTASEPVCDVASACTSSDIANKDIVKTANDLLLSLPGGDFNVQRNGNQADIWIMWMEPTNAASLSFGSANCRAAAISAITPPPRCFYWRAAL